MDWIALLAETADDATDAAGGGFGENWLPIVLIVGAVLLIAVAFIFANRKSKQRQKEYEEQIEAIRPGNKVKTTGGICGIVVEVCDDNTIIIETGSEASGKSYVKMDTQCLYQTDAKGPTQIAREEAEARRKAEKEAKAAAKEAAKNGKTQDEAPAQDEAPVQDEAPAGQSAENADPASEPKKDK